MSQVGDRTRSHELPVWSAPSDAQREPSPLSLSGGDAPGQLGGTSGPLSPTVCNSLIKVEKGQTPAYMDAGPAGAAGPASM